MSRHEIKSEKGLWVVGWDPPLQSYFLHRHDATVPEEENPVVWLGATPETQMPFINHLINVANAYGLIIDPDLRDELCKEMLENR